MRERLEQLFSDFYARDLPDLTPRNAYYPVLPHKATVVMGMRRTGKTWFCYQKMRDLLASGTDKSRLLYINFEDDRLLGFAVSDFQTILDLYYARFPENKECLCHFFFDEIQAVEGWERFIRRLIDNEKVQITLTGSSSKLLSSEIATSLRGRTAACELFPFSFEEYLNAAGILTQVPRHLTSTHIAKIRKGVKEYFQHGGFPETVGYSDRDRTETLQSYIDAVLFRDVVERYGVSNILLLRHLIQAILNTPSQKFSVNRFYNTMQSKGVRGSKNELYQYIEYLTDAYFLFPVPIHTESERIRQTNPDKIYVIDTGILNSIQYNQGKNIGAILENLVFNHLRRNQVRTEYVDTRGCEVDLLATGRDGEKTLIQVSYDLTGKETEKREIRALEAAGKALKIENRLIVTWDDERELDNGIRTVPVWKLLLGRV